MTHTQAIERINKCFDDAFDRDYTCGGRDCPHEILEDHWVIVAEDIYSLRRSVAQLAARELERLEREARIDENTEWIKLVQDVDKLYPTDNDWAVGRRQGLRDRVNDYTERIKRLRAAQPTDQAAQEPKQ